MKLLPHNFNILAKQEVLLQEALQRLPRTSRSKIIKALALAQRAHAGQLRDDGAPYVIHPIRMALSLIRNFSIHSPALINAALLHDVVEDTSIPLSEIKKICGARVALHVHDVTDMRPPRETEQQKRERKQKKLTLLLQKSRGSRIVKCADILDNIRSWPLLTQSMASFRKLPRWVQDARNNSLPFAKATHERMYREIKKTLDAYERHSKR